MGAIDANGDILLESELIEAFCIAEHETEAVIERERSNLERFERDCNGSRPAPMVKDRPVILVDDGMRTGNTMRAAVLLLRRAEPQAIVVAVPVASAAGADRLSGIADEAVCFAQPGPFARVDEYYRKFPPVTAAEIRFMLGRARNISADVCY